MNAAEKEAERKRLNELSGKVIGLCIEVHLETVPGLLESAYEECLAYELSRAGLAFGRQKDMPLRYKDVLLNCGYRLDFLIENSLVLELKAVQKLEPIHQAQLLTYLKLSRQPLGLLTRVSAQRDGLPAKEDAGENGLGQQAAADLFHHHRQIHEPLGQSAHFVRKRDGQPAQFGHLAVDWPGEPCGIIAQFANAFQGRFPAHEIGRRFLQHLLFIG